MIGIRQSGNDRAKQDMEGQRCFFKDLIVQHPQNNYYENNTAIVMVR